MRSYGIINHIILWIFIMLLTKPLHTDMGKNVYQILEKLNPLPSTGFIAGQSVISALLLLYGKGNSGPINDIDIYKNDNRITKRLRNLSFQPETGLIGFSKPAESTLKKPHYDGITQFFTAKRISLYHISEVSNENLLNIIKVKSTDNSVDVTPYQILESFDLNMVKVGLNIRNKKLYWTSDFEFFIKTGQLQVTNTHSIFHTACRIAKKKNEMPWLYTNDNLNYKTLTLPTQLFKKQYAARNTYNAFFGKKYFNIFKNHSELHDLFEVSETINKKTKKPTNLYTCTLSDKLNQYVTNDETQTYQDLIEYNFKSRDQYVAAHALSKFFINQKNLTKGKHYFNALNTLEHITSDYTKSQISLLEQNYLDGQVQLEWAQRIDKFIKKHNNLTYMFTGSTLNEQSKIYESIRKLQNEFGEHIIGLIETTSWTKQDIMNHSFMVNEITKYNQKLKKEFKNFEILPTKIYNKTQIRDLANRLAIKAEGQEMHHCVGGYSENVNQGRCRILSLSNPKNPYDREERSTAEVKKINDYTAKLLGIDLNNITGFNCPIRCVQHRAFANKTPSAEHTNALKQYIEDHNKTFISTNIEHPHFLYDEIKNIEQTITMPMLGIFKNISIIRLNKIDSLMSFINSTHQSEQLPVAGVQLKSETTLENYLIYADPEGFYIAIPSDYNPEIMSLKMIKTRISNNKLKQFDMTLQIAYLILQNLENINLPEWKSKLKDDMKDVRIKINKSSYEEEDEIDLIVEF